MGFVLLRCFDFLLQLEVFSVSPEVPSLAFGVFLVLMFLPFSVEIEDHGRTGCGPLSFLGLVPFVFLGLSAPWGEFSQLGGGFSPLGGFPGFLFSLWVAFFLPLACLSVVATDGLGWFALCPWGFSLPPGDAGFPSGSFPVSCFDGGRLPPWMGVCFVWTSGGGKWIGLLWLLSIDWLEL